MSDKDEMHKTLFKQFKEDRQLIMKQYEEIKALVGSDSPERVAVLGESLVKTSDLLLKQTAQLLEFVKITSKEKPKEENLTLSEEDKIGINEALKQ